MMKLNRIDRIVLKMPVIFSVLFLPICPAAAVWAATRVMVQDFENMASPPTVWVVNIPNENATVQVSTDHPHDGQQ